MSRSKPGFLDQNATHQFMSMDGNESNMTKDDKRAQRSVKRAMHKLKEGSLKSGKSGKRVSNRKQAIAIGLSEARSKGAKVTAK